MITEQTHLNRYIGIIIVSKSYGITSLENYSFVKWIRNCYYQFCGLIYQIITVSQVKIKINLSVTVLLVDLVVYMMRKIFISIVTLFIN